MINRIRKAGVVLAVGVLAAAAFAATQEFSFVRSAKVGDTHTFKTTVEFNAQGMDLKATFNITDKVVKVDGDRITSESAQSDFKIFMNGNEMDAGAQETPQKTTAVLSTRGETVEINSAQEDADEYRRAQMSTVIAPEKPVKVGDKWTHEFKANDRQKTVNATATYEVVGVEKVNSIDTVKLKWTFKESQGAEPMSADGHVWMDTSDFSVVKVVASYAKFPIPMLGPTDVKFNMERAN